MVWPVELLPAMRRTFVFLGCAAASLVFGGCGTRAPATGSAPPDAGAPPPTDAELSRFSVPLRYDFSAMLRVVERAVPTAFGSMDSIRMIGTDARREQFGLGDSRRQEIAFSTAIATQSAKRIHENGRG